MPYRHRGYAYRTRPDRPQGPRGEPARHRAAAVRAARPADDAADPPRHPGHRGDERRAHARRDPSHDVRAGQPRLSARVAVRALTPSGEHGIRRGDPAYQRFDRGVRRRSAGRPARTGGRRCASVRQSGNDPRRAVRVIRRLIAVAALGCSGCTQVATDANAIVALRFEGSAYPSVVEGDSLRDSLGVVQPLVATALNYRNEPVPDAPMEFLSRDTVLQVFEDGVVYARGRRPDTVADRKSVV